MEDQKMIFNFHPWTLDINVEATKQLYSENDYLTDPAANTKFAKQLSEKQKDFFTSIGIDPMKIKVDETIYDIPGDNETAGRKVYRMLIDFMICGKFLAVPRFQKEIYGSDEVFGSEFPDSLKIIEDNVFPAYDIDGLGKGAVFKHPCTRFDTETFQTWDCGYIIGTILIMSDL